MQKVAEVLLLSSCVYSLIVQVEYQLVASWYFSMCGKLLLLQFLHASKDCAWQVKLFVHRKQVFQQEPVCTLCMTSQTVCSQKTGVSAHCAWQVKLCVHRKQVFQQEPVCKKVRHGRLPARQDNCDIPSYKDLWMDSYGHENDNLCYIATHTVHCML